MPFGGKGVIGVDEAFRSGVDGIVVRFFCFFLLFTLLSYYLFPNY